MKKLIALPLFLFLLVSTIPVHAYLPPDLNVTYSGGLLNNNWLACSDITGTFYCYKTGTPSGSNPHIYIERYNATWGNREWCDTLLSGSSSLSGLFIVNTTHIGWVQNDNSIRYINATDEAFTDNVCYTTQKNGVMNATGSSYIQGGYVNDSGTGYVYFPLNNGIRFVENMSWVSPSFWDTTHIDTLRFPDQQNSSLLYSTYETLFFKYIDGSFDSNPVDIYTTWGIGTVSSKYFWDLFYDGDTIWLYISGGTRLYRFNFTLAEESGTNYITAVYPRDNETIGDFTPELHAIAYTGLNGTVAFYVDSVFKTNQTIITDGVSVDAYYTTDTLTEGQHYWTAYYYPDEVGYNWTTGTQYFMTDSTYEGSDYTGPDIVEGLGSYLDSSLQTPYGGEIFALLFSGILAGILWYYSHAKRIEYFIAPLMFFLACFSFLGLFPIWFLVLEVMVIAIFIFFKVR